MVKINSPKKFLLALLKRIDEDNIVAFAYQLTYSLLLAVFPFLIFLFTLIGYSDLDSSAILSTLDSSLPDNVFNMINDLVTDIVDSQRGGLMSFSVFLSVYSAAGGFRAFMKGTNKALGINDERSLPLKYLLSIFWVVLFALTILLALIGIVFGQQLLDLASYYFPKLPFEGLVDLLRVILPVVFIFMLILAFYIFVPAKKVKFRYAFPGAIFSTFTWTVFTLVFQKYVDNFANYSRFYGALGAVIALMLWLLLTSLILLLGVELNAMLIETKNIDDPFMYPVKNIKQRLRR
ncbi:YihY/virulence factor BrkB family protein [Alkalibacter saccharofermentans]|uniref:Membrane protein n=1 Tax=Alkalibacter saccharofermentans DSM 14828 TaxID=1120975 RepID=A0A1M4YL97_9FIRM|nr:YihY/virulence factor BrkB family protein [Alkalibacter saccharofermentans]SHF06186.1 membrane protein [Alkalibacter saccharofermentans DSM 14828]